MEVVEVADVVEVSNLVLSVYVVEVVEVMNLIYST